MHCSVMVCGEVLATLTQIHLLYLLQMRHNDGSTRSLGGGGSLARAQNPKHVGNLLRAFYKLA